MEKNRDKFFLTDNKHKGKKLDNDRKQVFNVQNKRHDNFNKNRPGLENNQNEDQAKKPFDKKTYRLKKYSKKYKLEQWEEKRKKKLLHNYYKDLQKESVSGNYVPKSFDEDQTDSVGRYVRHPDLIEKEGQAETVKGNNKIKKDPFQKAKEQYNKIKEEKLKKSQEIEKAKEEKKQKMQEYKKKKQERYKKLSKKTKKGQPVMTGRLELLLEKIQTANK